MPTIEELQAQVVALRAEVTRLSAPPPAVPLPPAPAPTKAPPAPTPRQLEIVRRLSAGGRATLPADPVLIQGQIDAITTVINSGVNSAGYGDKRTEFRSLSELQQILNGLEEDLGAALGTGRRIRQIRMTTQADKAL